MSEKPSYLGLLNAIAIGESEAEGYLNCWAATTKNDGVRAVLATVALREGEHGKAFAKRMCELGYAVLPRETDEVTGKMEIAASTQLSDREKFDRLNLGRPVNEAKDDVFTGMFRDKTIDIQTGALLGRYIAEERDTGRMLAACYGELCRQENGSNGATTSASSVSDDASTLAARLTRIEEMLTCMAESLSVRN